MYGILDKDVMSVINILEDGGQGGLYTNRKLKLNYCTVYEHCMGWTTEGPLTIERWPMP
jgi:hypothetical protein